jgi:hypothetical protein
MPSEADLLALGRLFYRWVEGAEAYIDWRQNASGTRTLIIDGKSAHGESYLTAADEELLVGLIRTS